MTALIKKSILHMVNECIETETVERNALLKSVTKTENLKHTIRVNLIERVYFYDILIGAMKLLPEYIELDKNGSFASFLGTEIGYLTTKLLTSRFTKLNREELVTAEAWANLIQKYNSILHILDVDKKCKSCNGNGMILIDPVDTEWINCDACKGSGKIKKQE